MWFSVVCTLIDEYASSQRSKCCGLTFAIIVNFTIIITKEISVKICLTNFNVKENVLFFRARGRARAENGITRHYCTVIDNGK